MNIEEFYKIKQKALQDHIPIIMDDTLEVVDEVLKEIKPTKILEIGTAVGYSAICFSKYLEEGDFLIDFADNVGTKDFVEWCANNNIMYLNTGETDWDDNWYSIFEENLKKNELRNNLKQKENVYVATAVDVEAYWDLIEKCLKAY